MKRVYLAGPMSGVPEHNFPAFFRAADEIRRTFGVEVENPADNDGADLYTAVRNVQERPVGSWADYLRRDIPRLLLCDTVFTLGGWATSRGAALEVHIARELGMDVRTWVFAEDRVPC